MNALSDHEAVIELLSLMKKNGRKLQAMKLSNDVSAIDIIDEVYNGLLPDFQQMNKELTELVEQCRALGEEISDFSEYQVMQNEAEQIVAKVAAVKGMIVGWAKSTVEDVRLIGVCAVDTAISTSNIHNMRYILQRQACSSILSILATQKIGVIEWEGKFRSPFLAPLRAVRKMLSCENNAAFAAIGGVEKVDQTTKVALEAQTDKSVEKKPSIRQDIEEKKAQVATRPTPDKAVMRRTDGPGLF